MKHAARALGANVNLQALPFVIMYFIRRAIDTKRCGRCEVFLAYEKWECMVWQRDVDMADLSFKLEFLVDVLPSRRLLFIDLLVFDILVEWIMNDRR